jgi:putative FmdB family regulatory protein
MPIREFKCDVCDAVTEQILNMSDDIPERIKCRRCGSPAKLKKFSIFAVAREGSDNAPMDIAIGRDARARWDDIYRRQEARDKVRRDNGQVGLVATGRNEFAPIAPEQKQLRTEVHEALEQRGEKRFEGSGTASVADIEKTW